MKNIEKSTRITWGLLLLALALHVGMIARALILTYEMHTLGREAEEMQNRLGKSLALTNAVRGAEEAIRACSISPSAKARARYCESLESSDTAAAEALAAGAVSDAFTREDISALRAKLAVHAACCRMSGAPGKAESEREFRAFYETASDLRGKLSDHSAAGLARSRTLSAAIGRDILSMVVSSSLIATVVLLLVFWVVYFMRRLNRALTEQRNEILVLKNGIEESSLGVVLTDTSGRIEYVNPAFTSMHGYSPEEAIGQNPRILKSGEMPPAVYSSLWKTVLEGRPWAGELRNRTKSGELVWIRANISPIRDTAGILTHFMALHKDINLEKRLISDLVDARKQADSANRAKSDFLATMSHEIRTPLNAIVGMSELIDEASLGSDQRQYLSILRNASDTLLSLINDVLDISKIESGHMELEEVPFSLEELTSKACEMMSVKAYKKNVEISCRIDPDVPVFLRGDATRLRQVIMNLMGNSVKFVEKGWVELSVRKHSQSAETAELLFSVRDTGIGIAPDRLGAVFEKFTQADASTTRKYGGTGLGLPISKMIIEKMGGKVWVESEVGVGTIFFFTASFRLQKEKESVYLPKADVAELKGRRFLVVDDNFTNRIIIREMVQSWGAVAEGAAGGAEGLLKLKEEQRRGLPFHCVFSDFNMPGMDGYEFCSKIISDPEISPKPAMALVTSDTMRVHRGRFGEIGVRVHIAKPVKKQTVLEAALQLIHGIGSGTASPAAAAAVSGAVPQPVSQKTEATKESLPPLSILIVDDSEDNRILMSSFLKGSKVKLDLAEDGREALEKLSVGRYDLVFMDIQMPEVDGFTATAEFRKLEASENRERTRIVALTAMATREDVEKALKAGCDDYLTKPIRKKVFYSYLCGFRAGGSGGVDGH
ncbi:MAG: response regulator [Elusimicrobiales bacterium]|nr:response regulator [Elusimicrobiales bacterium]